MSYVDKQEFREKVILTELSQGPKGYIRLLMLASEEGLSPCAFRTTFTHLHRCGRIAKVSSCKRAPWAITERGKKLLEALL